MKLARTLRLDVSDENVFENPYIAMATDDERILFLKAERKLLRLVAGFWAYTTDIII